MLTVILSAISLFMAAAVLYFFTAPKPTILLLRKMMSGDGVLKYPVECREEDLAVDVQMDLKYPSAHGRNYYDLYLPKNAKRKSPVIIWIHGGGFIAGGKGSTKNWGKLFADAGYAVAAVDYEYAPKIIYPGQTGQIQEFVRELKRRAMEGLPIDMNRVYLAGDSAGAHIAAQCGLLAVNADFANKIGVKSELSCDELMAMLLYCGPYNIEKIFKTDSKRAQFIIGKIGWALL